MELSELFAKHKTGLSPLSLKTYATNCKKVLENCGQPIDNLHYFHTHAKDIIDCLTNKYTSANTLKTKLASIIVCLRCMNVDASKDHKESIDKAIAIYTSEIVKLGDAIKADLSSGKKNEKQTENWLTESDKIKIDLTLKGLVKNEIKTPADLVHMRDYVMYNLYQALPSRNDFADSKLIYQPPKKSSDLSTDCNYIILNKRDKSVKYILNVYKTASTYGQKVIDLDAYLYPMLLEYKKAKENFSENPSLFLNSDATEPLSRNRMSVIYSQLGKIVGKKLGTSMNRHQAISDLVPLDKMKALADKMGHSVEEAMSVYAKLN
tara:strand:- start:76 stop:1038 length:963 start_codon:yes stop_codon:yes gene_type:complete